MGQLIWLYCRRIVYAVDFLKIWTIFQTHKNSIVWESEKLQSFCLCGSNGALQHDLCRPKCIGHFIQCAFGWTPLIDGRLKMRNVKPKTALSLWHLKFIPVSSEHLRTAWQHLFQVKYKSSLTDADSFHAFTWVPVAMPSRRWDATNRINWRKS